MLLRKGKKGSGSLKKTYKILKFPTYFLFTSKHRVFLKAFPRLTAFLLGEPGEGLRGQASKLEQKELARMIKELEKQMRSAAKELEFERAAMLRDQVYELRAMLADESDLPPWKKVQLLTGDSDQG